jgi:hypothetical protein
MDFPTFPDMRQRVGGVKGVIRLLGDAPQFDHKWKSFPKCPFCANKDCAGVFERGGTEWFKCQHTACSSGGRVVAETGYINLREGLSEDAPPEGGPSPAYKRLLELAMAYVEPSAKSEPKAEPNPAPEPEPEPVLPNPVLPPDVPALVTEPADDVALIRAAIEALRQDGKASIGQLKERLRIGHARALRIMDGLERWGVVGPSVPGEKFRAVLNLPKAGVPPPSFAKATAGEPAQNVGGIEPGSDNPAAATAPASPRSNGPAFINNGVSGFGSPGSPPLENGGPVPPELSPQKPPPVPPQAAAPGPAGKLPASAKATEGRDEKPALAPGVAVLRWVFERLTPTSSEMRPFMPDGSPVPSPLPTAAMKKIKFHPVSLDELRMLPQVACEALGLRANLRVNESVLLAAREVFDWEELQASGLWVEADHKSGQGRRPNEQYHGKGQFGKKPVSERRNESDKWHWVWCEPTLIPTFNEAGELVKLRPHKGGAASGTAAGSDHSYVPRDYRTAADRVEKFFTVIICEGEFKAAVIWWLVGGGAVLRGDGRPPLGVCALPGISFAKNPAYRAELEDWLRAVDCQRVIVAFDDEDKSHKPMRQAHDSQIYGRYLATSLNLELKIPALWLPLPKSWRVNGKADWDGGLVKLRDEGRGMK